MLIDLTTVPDEELFKPFVDGFDLPVRDCHALSWHAFDGQPKLAINLIGVNGSGKSVLPSMMCKLDAQAYWLRGQEGKKIITVLPTLGWGLVGPYKTNCSGADSLDKSRIVEALGRLAGTNLHLLLDGVITSNTKNTYYDFFRGIKEHFPHRKPLFCMLNYDFDTCLKRIMSRNGGKQIKLECLEQKFKNIQRYIGFYRSEFERTGEIPVHLETSDGQRAMITSLLKRMQQELGNDADLGFRF